MLKKSMMVFLILLMTSSVVVVLADTLYPNHNSNFYLNYGSGSTLCSDTSTAHSYFTYGDAINTSNARLSVYILNSSGTVVASDTSNSSTTYASAWWTRSSTTSHGHRATSTLIGR